MEQEQGTESTPKTYRDGYRDFHEHGSMLHDDPDYLYGWLAAFAVAVKGGEIKIEELSYPLPRHHESAR